MIAERVIMNTGKLILGKYQIVPKTNIDILKMDEFNVINVNGGKVFIAKEPMQFCGALFWTNIYSKDSIITKIELSNADEKYRMNYHTMNNALVEELRNENNRFLFEVLGNPTVTSIMGVEYDYCWGKILSFFDNKSAEAGIVIEYI